MRKSIGAMGMLGVLASLAGCGGGGGGTSSGSGKEPVACAAIVTFSEPILTIRSAVDATTQQPLPIVTVGDLKRNGTPVNLLIEVAGYNPANITVSGNSMNCTIACAFTHEAGTLTFTAQVPGYQAKDVTVEVSYAQHTSGCETTYSGGTRMDLSLTPLGPA